MKILRIGFLLLCFIIFLNCKKREDDIVEIRIENLSDFQMDNVKLNAEPCYSWLIPMEYGSIKKKSVSEYKTFMHAYSVPTVTAIIENKNVAYVATQCPDEQKLKGGKYRLKIDWVGTSQLSVQIIPE